MHPLPHLPSLFAGYYKATHGNYRGTCNGYRAVRRVTCHFLEGENPCGHMVVVKGAGLATLAGLSRTEMLLLCLDLYLQ